MRVALTISDRGLRSSCEALFDRSDVEVSTATVERPPTAADLVWLVDDLAFSHIVSWRQPPIQPVVLITGVTLANTIGLLTRPWVSQVVSTSLVQTPIASEHLVNVVSTLSTNARPRLLDWLGTDVNGRRVRLNQASKRVARLEKMTEYLESNGVSGRTIQLLRDAAEELLTNAFYDAPVAAGVVKGAISRTRDVQLPERGACDLAYGCRDDLAVVRVRDPFGSLTRARLVQVLTRCSRKDMAVTVDESMGGAGLGMWRIFTNATFVAVSVIGHRSTEILVGVTKRAPGARPFAYHLFFREGVKRTADRLKVATDPLPA